MKETRLSKRFVRLHYFADTFIANARQCLNGIATADGTISISDADSENDINVQGNNVNNFYTQGVKYLVLNNINNAATDDIANTMKEEGVVGIFANTTSPSDAAFENNENLWYVSSVSTQSGENMGNALVVEQNVNPKCYRKAGLPFIDKGKRNQDAQKYVDMLSTKTPNLKQCYQLRSYLCRIKFLLAEHCKRSEHYCSRCTGHEKVWFR